MLLPHYLPYGPCISHVGVVFVNPLKSALWLTTGYPRMSSSCTAFDHQALVRRLTIRLTTNKRVSSAGTAAPSYKACFYLEGNVHLKCIPEVATGSNLTPKRS